MKHICCSAMLLLLLACNALAQKKVSRFASINQVGIVTGSLDQSFHAQTVNGVLYKSWFAGLGVGIDNYYFKSIPLFADFRKNIAKTKQTPFIYIDIGESLPSKKQEADMWKSSNYSNGLYYDVGIGYQVPIKGNLSFNFSAGYSQKKLHETRTITGVIIDFPPYDREQQKEYYDYTFKRLSLKVALAF